MKQVLFVLLMLVTACVSQAPHAWRYTHPDPATWIVEPIAEHLPPTPHHYGATGRYNWAAGSNPAWNTSFFIDPANSTGCASDSNSGTPSTCGATGVGPLLSYAEVTSRFGPTGCPITSANVTYTWLSSAPVTDPVFICPQMNPTGALVGGQPTGPSILYTGTLQGSTVISAGTVTARSPSTKTPLQVNFGATTALYTFLQNTTHPSCAFVLSLVSGTNYRITQPMPCLTHPTGNGKGYSGATAPVLSQSWNEVNTWATSDSITESTFPGVYMVGSSNQNFDGFNNTGVVQIAHLRVLDAGAANNQGSAGFFVNQSTEFGEAVVDRSVQVFQDGIPDSKVGTSFGLTGLYNTVCTNGFMGGNFVPESTIDTTPFPILAGAIVTNPNASTIGLVNVALDDDVFVAPNQVNQCYISGFNMAGSVAFTRTCSMFAGAVLDFANRSLGSITGTTTRQMWSTAGSVNFNVGYGHLIWPGSGISGVSQQTAVNTFFINLFLENSQTSACAFTTAQPSVMNCGMPISIADLDQPAGLTTLTGGATFTLSNGSTAVSATGSAFTTQLIANQHITCSSQSGTFYQVSSITDDTHLVLTANYTGTGTSTATCQGVGYGGNAAGMTLEGRISNTTWGGS